MGDVFTGPWLLPQHVFRFCRFGNPHWTHLVTCIHTHSKSLWHSKRAAAAAAAACVYLNSLTHLSVSQTLWPEEDSLSGIWHDDHICVPSLRPGWRHQVVRWVRTLTVIVMYDPWDWFFNAFWSPTGIMSILFAGIVMSHYTHHNLSPVTQILMQQTLRTVAFMCGQWIMCITFFFFFFLLLLHKLKDIFLHFSLQKRVCLPSWASPSSASPTTLRYHLLFGAS